MSQSALQELDQLPPGDQLEPEVLELRCVIHQQMGHWVEAAKAFNALCARRDADVEHFIGWGCCLYELGRIAECREALIKAPASARNHGLWNFHLACYEAILGNNDEARRLILRSLELEPSLRSMALRNENLVPLLQKP